MYPTSHYIWVQNMGSGQENNNQTTNTPKSFGKTKQIRNKLGKVEDIIQTVCSLKWNWAGHLARNQEKLECKGY